MDFSADAERYIRPSLESVLTIGPGADPESVSGGWRESGVGPPAGSRGRAPGVEFGGQSPVESYFFTSSYNPARERSECGEFSPPVTIIDAGGGRNSSLL